MTSHSAAFPSVIAAIVTVAGTAVNPARVTRGRDFSNDPGDVVMIGVSELDDTGTDSAGTFQQTMQTMGGNRLEDGNVNGLVVATNGQSDQDAAMSAAFGYLASIEAAIRADPTLGLTGFESVVNTELEAGDVTESQNDSGATTALSFLVTYKIRI